MKRNWLKLVTLIGFSVVTLSVIIYGSYRQSSDIRGRAAPDLLYSKLADSSSLFVSQNKSVLLSQIGNSASQYSPEIVYRPGWNTKLIYYCKNTAENGVGRDRVWRAEFNAADMRLVDNRMVIDGTLNQDDDLSCSPGVVIGTDGTWHMYYVAADRTKGMTLFLYHATAAAPGVAWTKQGKVGGQFPQPYPGYMETPSPILVNGKIVMYFVGKDGAMHRATSVEGHDFTAPERLNAPDRANSGRVIYDGVNYYYFYAVNPAGGNAPPTEIRLALSADGQNFLYNRTLIRLSAGGWDGSHAWTPAAEFTPNGFRVYYSGNTGSYDWWGANTTIGFQDFVIRGIETKPLYRFWSGYFKDYYLSASEEERQKVLKAGWEEKGTVGRIYGVQTAGTIPLYQFWSDNFKDHYYSTSETEKADLVRNGWRFDGIIGYVPSFPSENTVPLYKLICGKTPQDHYYLFTTSEAEKTSARSVGCTDTGPAGNVLK